MSYRDYEAEEERRLYRIQKLEEETKKMQLRLEKGELALILAELQLTKESKNY